MADPRSTRGPQMTDTLCEQKGQPMAVPALTEDLSPEDAGGGNVC